ASRLLPGRRAPPAVGSRGLRLGLHRPDRDRLRPEDPAGGGGARGGCLPALVDLPALDVHVAPGSALPAHAAAAGGGAGSPRPPLREHRSLARARRGAGAEPGRAVARGGSDHRSLHRPGRARAAGRARGRREAALRSAAGRGGAGPQGGPRRPARLSSSGLFRDLRRAEPVVEEDLVPDRPFHPRQRVVDPRVLRIRFQLALLLLQPAEVREGEPQEDRVHRPGQAVEDLGDAAGAALPVLAQRLHSLHELVQPALPDHAPHEQIRAHESACRRSAIRSSGSSSPTLIRTIPSSTPARRSSSALYPVWLKRMGRLVSVSGPPRLAARAISFNRSQNRNALSLLPSVKVTMPPNALIWRRARSWSGWLESPGYQTRFTEGSDSSQRASASALADCRSMRTPNVFRPRRRS